MNLNSIFVGILTLSCSSARAVPASCSHTAEVHQTSPPTSQEGCLLAQRTHMAVVESLGETSDASFGARHAVTHRVGGRASVAVDSRASMSSRAAQWMAYRSSLPEVLSELEVSRRAINGKLQETINKFIDKQAGSADAVHAKLVEAKHQLNQLHDHVKDLASDINATDHEVTALNNQVESKLKDHDELTKKCDKLLQDALDKKKQDEEMLKTLKNEMEEMKQIANPNVSMSIANKTVIGGLVQLGLGDLLREPHLQKKSAASLMQIDSQIQKKSESPGSLFEPLHAAMMQVAQCMHKDLHVLNKRQTPNATTFNVTRKVVSCSVNDTVTVKIGDVEKDFSPKRNLADNEHSTVDCSEMNAGYRGAIWLTCNGGTITPDATKCIDSTSNATKCAEEKEELVEVYVKVYVDLARLIHSKELDITEGYKATKDSIDTQCNDQKKPLEEDAARLSKEASEKIKELEELRPKLEDAVEAEKKLREQVKKLGEESALIPDATSDLNKVRDAIKALSLCPGLSRADLKVPKYVGSYIDFNEDATANNDDQIDRRMRSACQSAFRDQFPGELVLAATVAELAQGSIHEMPLNNTATKPLLGSCPDCEGDADSAGGTVHKSGHARICWDAGAELKLGTQRKNCGSPPFAVACVVITEP